MKKITKKKQKEMLASISPAVYQISYNGQEIEVNPALTIEQRKAFCEGVWSLYWNADSDGILRQGRASMERSIRIGASRIERA